MENKIKKINCLQFICPVGFYGAERWVLALINNSDTALVRHDLAVTLESEKQNLEIVNQFKTIEGKSHKISMSGKFDLSVITKLCQIIEERKIDIIHTHGYKSDILGLLAAKKSGIKCVSTPHGFGTSSSLKMKVFTQLGAFSLRFFDSIVPLSKQLMGEVLEFGVPKQKVHYVQNGVDLTEIDPWLEKKQLGAKNDTKVIGFVGQMIPRKKVEQLLIIFDRLWKEDPALKLQLLGDGESRESLEKFALTLDANVNIEFLGFRNDRMEYLKTFDLFVMTSEDEGIPRCLMEAMAMKIPVAAYNIKGIDQLVSHDKTGLLSDYGDVDSLTAQCNELLTDVDKANELADNARQFVEDNFSGKRLAQEYKDIFHNVLIK